MFKKTLAVCLAALIMIALLPAAASAVFDTEAKIYDYAELLSASEETELYGEVSEFIDAYQTEVVILTTSDNDGTAQGYAEQFYSDYFGASQSGIVFLIDMDNRELWISTFEEANDYIDQARLDAMLDACAPYLTNGQYYQSVAFFINSADAYYSEGIPVTSQEIIGNKIYDDAELLDQYEEERLNDEIAQFKSAYQTEVIILTTSYNDATAQEYAEQFYRDNIGAYHSGLVFLIDMDNRQLWISMFEEANDYIDQARLDELLDACAPYLTGGQYYQSASLFLSKINSYYALGVSADTKPVYFRPFFVAIALVAAIIYVVILAAKSKTMKIATNAARYVSKLNLIKQEDVFLRSNTTCVRIQTNSGGSGGGSSGGGGGGRVGGGGRGF